MGKAQKIILYNLYVGWGWIDPQNFQLTFSQSSQRRAIHQPKSNVQIPTATEQNYCLACKKYILKNLVTALMSDALVSITSVFNIVY